MPNITTAYIDNKSRPRTIGKQVASNSLTLSGTYADVLWDATDNEGNNTLGSTTAWLDKGSAPGVQLDAAWVTSTGTPLSVKVYGTNDITGTVIVALPYIPAAAATGTTPAYQQETTFAKADWGNAATDYVGGQINCLGYRYIKVQAHAASANGSVTFYSTVIASA